MSHTALLVIVPDRISDVLEKGEYTPRYYNPGDLFDEVHILLTNGDKPDPALLQKTVGRARLHLHNLPMPSFARTLGWQTYLLRDWVRVGVQLAERVRPALIRVHGNLYNGYLAAQIKRRLGVPLVVSLHTKPDAKVPVEVSGWTYCKLRLLQRRMRVFERRTCRAADYVLPVYESIVPYARRLGAERVRVCYNALNPDHLGKKETYSLHTPPRIISVGRLFAGKNPNNLIRATVRLDAELTVVGDGPYRGRLQDLARECGIANKVVFRQSIANDELCCLLPHFDIFAAHSEYPEISKAVLEAMLSGLPVVLNHRQGKPVPELQGDWVQLVNNSADGYFNALHTLFTDDAAREALGRRAYAHAQLRYAPAKTEAAFVDVYTSLVPSLSTALLHQQSRDGQPAAEVQNPG